jgi:uncharacterized RDD family membrane protein YckC
MTSEPRPAGFWLRAGAFTIDSVLLFLAFTSVQVAMLLSGFPPALIGAAGICLSAAYFSVMTSACQGQTFGKMCAGIAVLRGEAEPDFGRALGRYFAYYLSLLPAGLGFLMAAFTREKKALHDSVAGTRVVRVLELPAWRKALVVGATFVPFTAGLVLGALSALLGNP